MAYDNTNTGALFRNVEKNDEHPNWPDYKGNINVNGQEFWLSAWVKEGKEGSKVAGKKFFSISIQPKEDKAAVAKHTQSIERRQVANKTGNAVADMDDDIPF